jgi:tagatose 6-phosphate kinase
LKKIVTVTLNAAWDKTYFVEGFEKGRAHPVVQVRGCAGGKGVNVARVIKALGGPVVATGLAGGVTGERIVAGLSAEGIEAAFMRVRAESRDTLAVVDRAAGEVTEFREPGGPVTGEEFQAFREHLRELLADAGFCVLSGSLPPGVPADSYAWLVRLAREAGVRVVLDASGGALTSGLLAEPFLVKPNREEALAAARALGGLGEERDLSRLGPVALGAFLAGRLVARPAGPKGAVVSLGEHGAVMASGSRTWHAWVKVDRPVNPVGSGDAMVAGMVVALAQGEGVVQALRLGVAAGAANTLTETAGRVRAVDVARLEPRVRVREVETGGCSACGCGVQARWTE